MDRATDTVYLDLTHNSPRVEGFLLWLLRLKRLDVAPQDICPSYGPALRHRGVQIEGFWPCVDYLLDIRPYPDVLPDTPEKRALTRSLTERLLNDQLALRELAPLYVERELVALPRHPTLLELAVCACAPSGYRWVSELTRQLDARIQQLALEDEE